MDTRTTEERVAAFTATAAFNLRSADDILAQFAHVENGNLINPKTRRDCQNYYRGQAETLREVLAWLELAGLTPQEAIR